MPVPFFVRDDKEKKKTDYWYDHQTKNEGPGFYYLEFSKKMEEKPDK